ncbi:MAG: hypothetical protein ABJB22_03990 [Verrucomicrobiota bacterium]
MQSVADSTRDEPRMVSYTPNSAVTMVRPRDLPPAVAFALEPDVERVIAIELRDIIGQIPAGYLKPTESFDVTRKVLLKAAELEKGMSTGQPSASLPSIYQQVPEIFLHTVPLTEQTPVALPFEKVLAGFQNLRVRRDQEANVAVPQVETPFLKATLQDSETFGTPCEPLQTCEMPPVRMELATAQSIAAAEPETSDRFIPTIVSLAPAPVPIPQEEEPRENGFAPARNGAPSTIPFHFPPNGTGAPAAERVPASSGAPVPTGLPTQNTPPRIPFKVKAPSDALRRKPQPPEEADWTVAATDLLASGGSGETEPQPAKIKLGLKSILAALPAFQLSGDAKEVPDEVGIEFPFLLIEAQLAAGRIALAPKVFEEMLPQEYRHLFNASEDTLVSLPLEEVLKNLPGTSLRIRDDQEEHAIGVNFNTPFSLKAEEDAKRLQIDSGPISKQSSVPAETEVSLETAPGAEEKFDAKSAVAQAIKLPGVSACAVTFADGLSLAGNLPEDLGVEGLCAMAPSLLHRIQDYMVDTKLGGLNAMTLHCAKSPLTFFMHGNICLSAVHSIEGLTAEIREQLGRMAQELSQIYSQPEVSHVDH